MMGGRFQFRALTIRGGRKNKIKKLKREAGNLKPTTAAVRRNISSDRRAETVSWAGRTALSYLQTRHKSLIN